MQAVRESCVLHILTLICDTHGISSMGDPQISEETRISIRKLCRKLTLNYPKAKWEPSRNEPVMLTAIPGDTGATRNRPFIPLFGEFYVAYQEALELLRNEATLEYMDYHELKEGFWSFIYEVIADYETYRDSVRLDQRIDEFLSGITKPVVSFEVLVPISNLDMKDSEIKIGNYTIRTLTREALERFGLPKEHYWFDKIAGKTVAIIPERGNNPSLVVDRARKRADIVIRTLQASLATNLPVHEEKLLFGQGAFVVYRESCNSLSCGCMWNRSREPIPLELNDTFKGNIDNFVSNISESFQDKPSELHERLVIALMWIGRAVDEPDLDIKVIHLSTALESMLTTQSDEKKGETLAYRMILLSMCLGKPFLDPDQVVRIYELRSKVVHGSAVGEASNDDYLTVRRLAVMTLMHVAEFARREKMESHRAFLKALDSSKHVDELLDWLFKHGTKPSSEIRTCMIDRLRPQSTRML